MTTRPPTHTLRFRALLLASLVPLLPAALWSQPEASSTFEGETDVVEVQIPVTVIGKDKNPIRGLGPEDFVVYDRRSPQELVRFEVIDLDILEPGTRREAIEEAIPAVARRHFLLLFDLSFSHPSSIIKARVAARQFVLEHLHPTDLAAVATFSVDTGTKLLVTFTPDRAQLARAIDTLGAPRLLSRTDVDPLRFIIEDPGLRASDSIFAQDQEGTQTGRVGSLQQEIQAYIDIINKQMSFQEKSYRRGRIAGWLSTLEDLAMKLASVEGRKHVVVFSEGFDGRLMLGRAPDGNDPSAQVDQQQLSDGAYWMVDTDDIYGNAALQNDVLEMVEKFRRSDCLIQAVDIAGLGSDSVASYRARRSGQDALFYVANETGGALYEDANEFGDQLVEVLERSSVTYLLTIRPRDLEFDGSYHALSVDVDVPRGSDVAHRDGYYAPRPFEELHPMEKALLASDAIAAAAPRDDVSLDVLTAAFRANERTAYVPVIIEVEGKSLLFGHSGDSLQVEFFAYVSNTKGEMQDFFTQLVTIDLERGRDVLRKTGIKYYGSLELEPGEYLVRVLVRNATSGRTGVRNARVSVPTYDLLVPDLLPPFFLEEPNKWVMVRERRDGGNDRSVIYPFTINGDPYVPAARPVLSGGEVAEMCLVAYNLDGEEVELGGTVVRSDGEELEASSLDLVERTVTGIEGLDKLLATFEPSGLAAGDYTLRVAVRQPGSDLVQESSIPFRID